MPLVKKFLFSIPFVVSFIGYCLLLNKFLANPNLLFGIDTQTILLFVWIVVAALCTGIFFSLFVTISQDRKIILVSLPAILLSSFLLLPDNSSLVFTIGSFFLFFLVSLSLQHTLNTYFLYAKYHTSTAYQ